MNDRYTKHHVRFFEVIELEDEQVKLNITTDKGFTAEFLRELASAIESTKEDKIKTYETFRGCAEIEWTE